MTTVPDVLDVLDGRHPADSLALVDERRSVEYGELPQRVRSLASFLIAQGISAGDRVAVGMTNRIESVELYLACLALGAIWVGVNPNAPRAEQDRQLNLVAPSLVVSDEDVAEPQNDIGDLPSRPALDAPVAIAFTSGTTSLPKAVVHSRAAISLSARAYGHDRICPDDRVGIVLPLAIHNLMVVGAMSALMAGACVLPVARMDGRSVAQACRRNRLTLVSALVPATVFDLVHDDAVEPGMLSTLRYAGTGAAGLAEELRAAFETKFGVALCGSYGMTEAPGPVAVEGIDHAHRPGCSGKALSHIVIDTDANAQFVVSAAPTGPFAKLFGPPLGRWDADGFTPWPDSKVLRTGDYGCVEEDGSVRIESRRMGVIVRGGVNIDVGELESVLGEIPGVRGVAVAGECDRRLGERIVAFVELAADASRGADETRYLTAKAREVLSRTKCPDEYVIIDALPRNAMGKVDRMRITRPVVIEPKEL